MASSWAEGLFINLYSQALPFGTPAHPGADRLRLPLDEVLDCGHVIPPHLHSNVLVVLQAEPRLAGERGVPPQVVQAAVAARIQVERSLGADAKDRREEAEDLQLQDRNAR